MNVQTFSALAEPNRLAIVELLLEEPLPVGKIAEKLKLNQPQTSKHLRVLSDAGLVDVHPIANRRIYKLRPEPFQELDRWLELVPPNVGGAYGSIRRLPQGHTGKKTVELIWKQNISIVSQYHHRQL